MPGSISTASICATSARRATEPTVTPEAKPITSTLRGAGPNSSGSSPSSTWVDMSIEVEASVLPFTLSAIRPSLRSTETVLVEEHLVLEHAQERLVRDAEREVDVGSAEHATRQRHLVERGREQQQD